MNVKDGEWKHFWVPRYRVLTHMDLENFEIFSHLSKKNDILGIRLMLYKKDKAWQNLEV